MPRKKKGDNRGSSPEKLTQTGLSRVGQQYGGGTGNAVWSEVAKRGIQIGHVGPTPEQEKTYFELQEMFKGVDGEVIYMVLAESDWKVDEAVEKLLVLGQDHTTSPQEVNTSLQSVAQSIRHNVQQQQHSTSSEVNLRSRLPTGRTSESEQQIPTLSPKTPHTANPNQHPLLGTQSGIPDVNLQSAMEAIGSYANNQQNMLDYLHHGYHEQPTFESNVFNIPTGTGVLDHGPYNTHGGFGLENLSQNFSSGDGSMVNLDSQTGGVKLGYPAVNENSLGMLNTPFQQKDMFSAMPISSQQEDRSATNTSVNVSLTASNNKPDLTVKPGRLGATHKPPDAHKRKGHRKKTLSLNPEEREDLENLIEDVILSGVGDGVIDSEESTSSESEEDPNQSQFIGAGKVNDRVEKQHDSSSGSDKDKPSRGKKGKQGKDGKVYPAQLKVAVKHMKNLPPRFLRRLQTAEEKKKEANAKGGDSPNGNSEYSVRDLSNQVEILTIKEQPEKEAREKESSQLKERERQRNKQEQLKEKKQKIRNMLDNLDQYEDEENKPEEKDSGEKEVDNLQTATSHNSLQGTSPGPQAPMSPNNMGGLHRQQGTCMYDHGAQDLSTQGGNSPQGQGTNLYDGMQPSNLSHPMHQSSQMMYATNCEDLEREFMKTYDASGLSRSDQSAFATPPSVRRNRSQGTLSQHAQMNHLPHQPQYQSTGSQFSVNAPEFVPRSFTPTSLTQNQVAGPHDPMQSIPQGMVQLPNLSQPPPVFPLAVSSGGGFQGPLGRLSPQMSNVNIGSVGLGSPSNQVPMPPVSTLGGFTTGDTSTTMVSTGNHVQASPSFMIPKVQQNLGSNPVLPGQPGTGVGIIPFQPAYPPPNMPPFGAYPAPGPVYPQQYPYRAPFLPHLGFGWAKDSKSPNKQFGHPPNPRMNTQGKHPGQKDKKGQLMQQNNRPGSANNNNKQLQASSVTIVNGGRKTYQSVVSLEKAKQTVQNLLNEGKKTMIILRGAPGSGKTTLAKEITFGGVSFSTDDFFARNGTYEFDFGKLSEAHEWNKIRAKRAIEDGKSPVIIDNTNSQSWEMKPYIYTALNNEYHVEIFEPDTPWRLKPKELAKRNTHGVCLEIIQNMVERFEHNVSVDRIMGITNKKIEESENTIKEDTAEPSSSGKRSRKKKKKKRKKDRKKRLEKSGDAADDESSEEEVSTDRETSQEKELADGTATSSEANSAKKEAGELSEDPPVSCVDSNGKDRDPSEALLEMSEGCERKAAGVRILPTITEGVILETNGTLVDDTHALPSNEAITDPRTGPGRVVDGSHKDAEVNSPSGKQGPASRDTRSDLADQDELSVSTPPVATALSLISEMYNSGSSESSLSPQADVGGLTAITQAYQHKSSTAVSEPKIQSSIRAIDIAFKSAQTQLALLGQACQTPPAVSQPDRHERGDKANDSQASEAHEETVSIADAYWRSELRNGSGAQLKDAHNVISSEENNPPVYDTPPSLRKDQSKLVSKAPVVEAIWHQEPDNYGNASPLEDALVTLSLNTGSKGQYKSGDPLSAQSCRSEDKTSLPAAMESTAATNTEARDFVIVNKVLSGKEIDDHEVEIIQCVRTCTARAIASCMAVETYQEHGSPSRPLQFKIDEGCSTDDLPDHCPIDGLEFLTSCFPTVVASDLSDILQHCGGDIEWAVNLLLDSGYEYNDPKHSAAESAGDLSQSPPDSPSRSAPGVDVDAVGSAADASPSKRPENSPVSLLAICHDSLRSKGAITDTQHRQFAHQTLERLRTIEKFQLAHESDGGIPSGAMCGPRDPPATATAISPEAVKLKLDLGTTRMDLSGENTFLSQGVLSPEASQTVRRQQSLSECHAPEGGGNTDGSNPPDAEIDDLALTLSPLLAKQLIKMFGPVGFHITPDSLGPDDYMVRLNRRTARNIHRRWALTMQEKFTLEEAAIHKMMADDEELAKRLQAEEVRRVEDAGSQRDAAFDLRSTSSPARATNLREIMDEEVAIEVSKREHNEGNVALQSAENTISAKLKRQKLGEMYPQIDGTLLDEVFQANACSLEASVNTVEASTGDKPHPAQTVYRGSPVNAVEYDDLLVKQILQESMNDQWLGVDIGDSEYQAMDDPDYHDFRAEASMHYRLRQELFQKAQEAYRRGMKDVASFYSQQGHLHTEKLKEANRRAGDQIMACRNHLLRETNSVDLHGLHVDEALDALQNILSTRESELQTVPDKRKHHLSVITGKGSHSRGGVARIKPAVIDFLNRKGYKYLETSPGVLKVLVKHNA